MPSVYVLLLVFFICSVFSHATAEYEYDSFITKQQHIDNKTILAVDNANLLVCPLDAAPVIQKSNNTNDTPSKSIRFSSPDLDPLITALESIARRTLDNIHQVLCDTKNKVHQFEYALFFRQTKDDLYRMGSNMVPNHLPPLGYSLRRMVVPIIYSLNDKKEDLIQWLDDIISDPQLEWYIFTTRLTDHWTRQSRRLGMDAFIRHVRHQLINAPEPPPFSHLDDLFKTMLETDHHSKFYQQQMAQYYQYLSPLDQERVRYSQRDFTQWAQNSALQTHEFVLQTQQDWIQLMQSLYYDMETRLDCLSRPPPSTVTTTTTKMCLSNHRRHAWLLLAPNKDQQEPVSTKQQRYEWMFQLDQIHRELKITMDCICPRSGTARHQQRIDGTLPAEQDATVETESDDLESIEKLSDLKNTMVRRFARLDKELYRSFYSATPPGHQPIHTIYNRLRENVSAKNKSTYETYLTRLIHSWMTMMATTLDTANSVADDLSWLNHSHDNHPSSMALIWASAQRKLDRNNAHLIHQWESLFNDLDQSLQSAWMDMLDMVDQSHRSSFERVKTFWNLNKAKLSGFFSSLFRPTNVDP